MKDLVERLDNEKVDRVSNDVEVSLIDEGKLLARSKNPIEVYYYNTSVYYPIYGFKVNG